MRDGRFGEQTIIKQHLFALGRGHPAPGDLQMGINHSGSFGERWRPRLVKGSASLEGLQTPPVLSEALGYSLVAL